jgi:hypothetical protein
MTSLVKSDSLYSLDQWRYSLFSFIFVGLFICNVYAFKYSPYPNQIFWLYVLLFCLTTYGTFHRSRIAYEECRKIVLVFALYICAFYVVSFWELIPGVSIRALPTYSLNGMLLVAGFAVGHRLSRNQLFQSFEIIAWLVVFFTVGQWVLEPSTSRFGDNPTAMVVLPFVVASRKSLVSVCLVVTLLGSQSLTSTIASLLGVITYVWLFYRGDIFRFVHLNLKLIVSFLTIGTVGAYLAKDYVYNSLERFQTHYDPARNFITENSKQMLMDSNGIGIGYMNFYGWTSLSGRFRDVGRTGVVINGVNLHNSFMTWALEGGVLVCLSVVLMFVLTFRRIRLVSAFDQSLGALFLSWCTAFGIYALYHQTHSLMQFWLCIGLIWGWSAKLRSIRDYG